MSKLMAILVASLTLTVHALSAAEDPLGFDHPWQDGLYSTITEPFCTGGVQPKSTKYVTVKVPDFRTALKVTAVVQPQAAPIVVILNGSFARQDGSSTNLWMSWLEEKGFHVLSFDSTLNARFVNAARVGVPGHPGIDAEVAAKVIQAALAKPEFAGKVTRIGIVGISYGATQSLHLAKLAREGRLPFKVDAVQAYNPPVSLCESLAIVDGFFSFEWKLTEHLMAFYNLQREHSQKQPLDPRKMEAAIGRVFRLPLADTVNRCDELFRKELDRAGAPRLLPESGGPENRESYAEAINFQMYMDQILVPFWKAQGRITGKTELLEAGQLECLLKGVDARVEVILTTNDPLNQPGAAEEIARRGCAARVTLLPRGGHVGYVNAQWTHAKLNGIFDARETWVAGR